MFVNAFFDGSGGFSNVCLGAGGAWDGIYASFTWCGNGGFGDYVFDGGRGASCYGRIRVVDVIGDHVR